MKRIFIFFLFVVGIFLLTGCGNHQEIDYENYSPALTDKQIRQLAEGLKKVAEEMEPIESPVETTPESTEENIQLAERLYYDFNRHGQNFSVEINDSTTDEKIISHQEIVIHAMERYTRNSYEECKEAIDAGTATSSEISTIYEVQLKVEEAAKELESEDDLIRLVYSDIDNEDISIAVANKAGSILPLVK